MAMLDEIKQLIGEVLQLGERTRHLERSTMLLGDIPEFDSMTVVSLITVLEERFGIVIDDDELDAEAFETVGSLCNFVERKIDLSRSLQEI